MCNVSSSLRGVSLAELYLSRTSRSYAKVYIDLLDDDDDDQGYIKLTSCPTHVMSYDPFVRLSIGLL